MTDADTAGLLAIALRQLASVLMDDRIDAAIREEYAQSFATGLGLTS